MPRAWAWSALTDAQALSSWSPIQLHDVAEGQVLRAGLELGCHLDILGRSVGATVCVLEAEAERHLSLRVESLAASLFESFTLTSLGVTQTQVQYAADVLSPVPGRALEAWFASHAEAVLHGMDGLLRPVAPTGAGAPRPAPPESPM